MPSFPHNGQWQVTGKLHILGPFNSEKASIIRGLLLSGIVPIPPFSSQSPSTFSPIDLSKYCQFLIGHSPKKVGPLTVSVIHPKE